MISGRALNYRGAINLFVMMNRDLQNYELEDKDWDAIQVITSWLKLFRHATTDMLLTKRPMLSAVHTIFQGL